MNDPSASVPPARRPGRAASALTPPAEAERLVSNFEHALWTAHTAFERWVQKCMASIGETRLTVVDCMVLHAICHRARSTRLNDIGFVLNMDDGHVVAYSIRKLERLGLLDSSRQGKEKFYHGSAAGAELVNGYRAVREELLIEALAHFPGTAGEVAETTDTIRALAGFYDQSARRAAVSL